MTGTSVEDQNFVDEAFAEIDQMTLDKLKANEDVVKLISSSQAKVDTIEVGGVKIRFKAFLDRKLRHQLHGVQKTVGSDFVKTENAMYDTLASLCMDEPWNKRETWVFIEDSGGDVSGILRQMMERITENVTNVKDFRPKS
jgi:hypothetical protein